MLGDDAPDQAIARVRARTESVARAAAREQQDLDALGARVDALEERTAGAAVRADLLASRRTSSSRRPAALEAELAARSAELEAAVRTAEAAQVAADEAEEARHRTAARAEALERALADLQGAGGRELLRDVDGVVGSLVDLVEIDDGWDAAFEAAIGAGVAAVVVDGRRSAQAALATLREGGVTGAILTPRPVASGAVGVGELPPGSSAEPVRRHVRVRQGGAAAESVLDTLVGRAVRVDGWEEAIDLSLARDDLVVVTPEGDRFAATGWRVRSATSVVTAASVEEARRRAEDAAGRGRAGPGPPGREPHRARPLPRRADRGRAGQRPPRLGLRDGPGRPGALRRGAAPRWPASSTRPGPRWRRRSSAWPRSRPSRRTWPGRCPSCRRRSRPGRRSRSGAVGLPAPAPGARGAGGRRGRAPARAGRAPGRGGAAPAGPRRGAGHRGARAGAAWRPRARRWPAWRWWSSASTSGSTASSSRCATTTRTRSTRCGPGGEKLERLRQDRHTTEQRLEAVRTRTRTLDLESNEVDLRMEALHEHIARDLGATPEELTGLPEPEAPEGTTLPQHAEELERKLAALGPVNPLALEELSTLEERHKELEAQVDDVRGARRELHEVVRTLDHEIMTSFAAAAADVNEHFSTLIAMLFPGGTGRLLLVEPDDLLNTGVEIEVRPAGRNVRRVSLLSGGERSMAALAFLFAVFRSRPSPFYMMDEVEAALDDVNLSRFLALVHEFRDEAQLLIVSHQKRTMETGDALYGVTMAPGRLVPGGQPEGGEGEGAGVTGTLAFVFVVAGRDLRRRRGGRRGAHPAGDA